MRDIDLSAIRARLAGQKGPAFWRSLEEVAETPEFQAMLHREFPEGASEFTDPAGRRDFLRLMGASIALAGAAACTRQPTEHIVPYVKAPEDLIPGKPLFFATAMPFAGTAVPVLVESHMGRPTKIEPNPEHPFTRGGTDLFAQASILDLYDPDRSQTVMGKGEIRPWSELSLALDERRGGPEGRRRRRAADPVRRGHVPDARGADPGPAHGHAAGQVDPVRGDRLRQRARRRQAGVRRVRRAGLPHRPDRRDPLARRRPARRRSRQAALRAGLRGAPPRRRRARPG